MEILFGSQIFKTNDETQASRQPANAGERSFSNGHVGAAIEASIYNRNTQRPITVKGTQCAAFPIALNSHSISVY